MKQIIEIKEDIIDIKDYDSCKERRKLILIRETYR